MTFLKQISVLLVVTLLFAKTLLVPALFLNYELRKSYIIQNFCENKNRPELHCDGMCYLAKQIKATEQEDERQATNTFLAKVYQVEHIENSLNLSLSTSFYTYFIESGQINRLHNLKSRIFSNSVFQPPRV